MFVDSDSVLELNVSVPNTGEVLHVTATKHKTKLCKLAALHNGRLNHHFVAHTAAIDPAQVGRKQRHSYDTRD